MMSRFVPHIFVLLILLICLGGNLGSSSGVGEPKIRCKEAERQALLKIKQNFFVSHHDENVNVLLSSWGEEKEKRECCNWIGIQCSNDSGHVMKLALSPSTFNKDGYYLRGDISSSIVDLKHLSHLDLSRLSFESSIPSSILNLTKLRYLNLSSNQLVGETPDQLGNLSSLQFLDLSKNTNLKITSLKWVSCLSSLRVLDLTETNMSLANDWVHVVTNLPFLTQLLLSRSGLPVTVTPTSRSLVNSSQVLKVLDLSFNDVLPQSIFQWLFNYNRSLVHLDLSFNQLDSLNLKCFVNMTAMQHLSLEGSSLKGSIPEDFGNNMASLDHLDLSSNMLEGEIPESIWKICTLRIFKAHNNSLSGEVHFAQPNSSMSCANFPLEYLDISQNKIMGPLPNFTLYPSLVELNLSSNNFTGIPTSIGQLSKLVAMDVSENSIQGVISEAHFANLSNLKALDLHSNPNLAVKIHSDWIPPFQLLEINLGSCNLGPHFPKWLQTQKDHYAFLDISNSRISDSIPDWFWDFNSTTGHLDLSKNEIRGNIHDVQKKVNLLSNDFYLDLSSNQLHGPIPSFLLQVNQLRLFNNSFSQLNSLCTFTEPIPLTFLDVSYNQLSGNIPDCWSPANYLQILVLSNNHFSGKVPVSLGFLTQLKALHLGNNNLTEDLPSSLVNCTRLMVFDVGSNKLAGPIPTWIGTSLESLLIISLRSNHFNGSMPSELCHLVYLQMLDLSSNDISGEIPKCLGNITSMKHDPLDDPLDSFQTFLSVFRILFPLDTKKFAKLLLLRSPRFADVFKWGNVKLVLVWKGRIYEFRNVELLTNIDLSSNKLTGEIPRDITELVKLNSFNLSRNNLNGHIPEEIGQLRSLDALDLSNNHFSGQIPRSLSQVDRLSTLDLSSNNLSGEIPTSTQLQSQNASAFAGNPQLCGDPLPNKCPDEEPPPPISSVSPEDGDKDDYITKGFYISLALGVVVGFWGVCGTLIFSNSLRYAYLKLLEDTGDWLYVTKEVYKRKLLRLIQT